MPGYYLRKGVDPKEYYLGMANRPPRKNKFSKYRGISKSGNDKRPYRAYFRYQGVGYSVGVFADELEAVRAYNKAITAVIGPHAVTNPLPIPVSDDAGNDEGIGNEVGCKDSNPDDSDNV